MLLETYRTARTERNAIKGQADAFAETMAYSPTPDNEWRFGIEVPSTQTIMGFAGMLGEATIDRLRHYTSMEIAEYNPVQTALANAVLIGVGTEGLDQLPPPRAEAHIIFDRTTVGKVYKF